MSKEGKTDRKQDVIIIGAGLAGLTAAIHLRKKNLNVLVLEATDRVGGRVKTDHVEGFLLDRGFQVLLKGYAEAQSLLDYEALQLKPFLPGALILNEHGIHQIMDPARAKGSLFSTLFSRAGTLGDKLKMLSLKQQLLAKDMKSIFEQEEISTLEVIQQYGFSEKMLRNFFHPFLAGIFLENALHTSRRMFDFVFKVFSSDDTSIPAQGMEAIPLQLAAQVGKKNILCNKKVKRIDGKKVITTEGEEFKAGHILIATEPTGFASHYIADGYSTDKHSATCVYFKAPQSPLSKPIIALNASSDRVVNNLCVMSNVSPAYAPEGQHLISASIIGLETASDEELSQTIKAEMAQWFGQLTQSWEHLKTYRIEYALPNQDSVSNYIPPKALHIKDNLFVAGDYLLNGSINAAMKSGRLAAEAIAEAIKGE